MGASEVLRYIEVAGIAVTFLLGLITGSLAYRYRKEIAHAEKMKAERKRARLRATLRNDAPGTESSHEHEMAQVG